MQRPAAPRQIPLDLARRPGFSRDELVVSEANAAAVALVDSWPAWPSSTVVVAGPPGAGKSHLAQIWRERAGARPVDPAHVGPADIEAAAHAPLLVDGADAGAIDEPGLFHLINAARTAGTHVLLAARRFPSAWGVGLPDLASRLRAASLVEIREPDDTLLSGVIVKLFADRQVEIDPQVVQFVVRRIERSLATANRVVERLDRVALERKSRVTRPLAAEVISAMDAGQAALDL